jgi:precorrin-2 dehydrogenase/sirohydrochlorin ferrochelatase
MKGGRFAYPAVLDLRGRRAVVVGGGRVALRKARALLAAGASVRVVAPKLVAALKRDPRIECRAGPYRKRHLRGAILVIAATDDEGVNARIAADARAAGALVNVVDRPEECDFIVPSQVRRGDLVIAVTTGGAAPSLSRRIRERLERQFGPEYARLLAALRRVRQDLKARGLAPAVRRRIFERLTRDDVVAAARRGPAALRRAIVKAVAAEGRPPA